MNINIYIHHKRKTYSVTINMNQYKVNLLDLPNEILLIILKKLDNMDVLYSLFDLNNERLATRRTRHEYYAFFS